MCIQVHCTSVPCFFFFNDTATTEIYTLSLHDALPISARAAAWHVCPQDGEPSIRSNKCSISSKRVRLVAPRGARRSEEHTSELQSRQYLVCRLLLEKKKR